jgi:hypothetical protein
MSHSSDRYKINFVGGLAVALGLVLMLLTIFAAILTVFSYSTGGALKGALSFGLCLVIASGYLGIGTKLTRLKYYTAADIETLRLSWTALLLLSVLGAVLAYYLLQPLVGVCALMIVVLVAIRRSVIRLSS